MAENESWWKRLRDFGRAYAELTERRMIRDRPWTHDDLHWAPDGGGGVDLHGHLPGRPGSRGPVTGQGWCACHLESSEVA